MSNDHDSQTEYGFMHPMSGTLFVVATPIGNLEDLTPRARQVLAQVDLVAAEDTRHTRRLLSHLGVNTALLTLHDHNEEMVVNGLIDRLESDQSIALVSDAGTPLVSDPGYRLVRDAHRRDIPVTPIPGASAVTAALAVAGLPTDRFCFEGFLPAKKVARVKALNQLRHEARTMVFFESVHRIATVLEDLCDVFGADRNAFVGRELTKMHEQCVRATLGELLEAIADGGIVLKGEFAVIVAGSTAAGDASVDTDRLLRALDEKLSARDAAQVAAAATGQKKNQLYERLLAIREGSNDR